MEEEVAPPALVAAEVEPPLEARSETEKERRGLERRKRSSSETSRMAEEAEVKRRIQLGLYKPPALGAAEVEPLDDGDPPDDGDRPIATSSKQ